MDERGPGPEPPTSTEVLQAFLRRYFEDQDTGAVRSLAEYQALFEGHEPEIERTWRVLAESTAAGGARGRRGGLAPGERLGAYRIVRELGRGGQGAVFLAEDTRVDRRVALKVLLDHGLERDGPSVQRLKREAEAAAQLHHPSLCPIFDVDVESDPPYLTMPFLEGRTLASWLASAADRGSPSSPLRDAAATMVTIEEVARALDAAHRARIVHRDVKPANVLVAPNGRPVLLDLGVARTAASELTRTGAQVGTLPYMAPEQVEGGADVDGRADVWALGVTLFECLTGRLPFDAPTEQRLSLAILRELAPRVRALDPALPRDLEVVLSTALEKEPRHRYQTAGAFADDLVRVREHRTIEARPPTTGERLARWCRRNPALAGAVSAAFAILLAGLAVALVLLRDVHAERVAKGAEVLEKQRALDEVQRLADDRRLRVLLEEESGLWPVREERADTMASWLLRAGRLAARLPAHRGTLARLEALAAAAPEEPGDATTVLWHAETLADLVARLEGFTARIGSVRAREALARTIAADTVERHAGEWARARERLAADARFAGFELAPLVGLVPLGPDPVTGLEEFAHLESGAPPVRAPDGRLALGPESALVFALLPGGRFEMGGHAPSPERPLGEPNVDPFAGPMGVPVRAIELDPFLLAKFETTQGQWLRLTGANPAYFQGSILREVSERDLALPVEHVSWETCAEVAAQRDLLLPTEAQWEYACRAGTTSLWYTGDDELTLQGFENLADEGTASLRRPGDPYVAGMDDGAVSTQFAGSYDPNPFGLHDLHGNVMEWCRDVFGPYTVEPRPGDGLREPPPVPALALRGGSFRDAGGGGSSAARHNGPPHVTLPVVGVRLGFPLR